MRPLSSGTSRFFSILHVVAVAQGLQDGGIGRGTADAELFHALDEDASE